MTISVVTPTLNTAATIRKTLESVVVQTYPISEYILVDGNSTDQTLNIVHEFSNRLSLKVVTQDPSGVYAAMNAGIRVVTGDVVCILNGDDYFYTDEVIAKVASAFKQNPEADIVYGDIVYRNPVAGTMSRQWRPGGFSLKKMYRGWSMPHPAVFVRRSLYEKVGLFNETFRIAGDYEIMVRWLLVHGVKTVYIPETLVVMNPSGISGGSLRARRQGWNELRRAWEVNGLQPPFAFILRRLFFKLHQFVF